MKNTYDELYYKALGNELKRARRSTGMSYEKVVEALQGYKSKSMMIRYESGKYRIDNDTLTKLCSLYCVDIQKIRASATRIAMQSMYDDDETDEKMKRIDEMFNTHEDYDTRDAMLSVLARKEQSTGDSKYIKLLNHEGLLSSLADLDDNQLTAIESMIKSIKQ